MPDKKYTQKNKIFIFYSNNITTENMTETFKNNVSPCERKRQSMMIYARSLPTHVVDKRGWPRYIVHLWTEAIDKAAPGVPTDGSTMNETK